MFICRMSIFRYISWFFIDVYDMLSVINGFDE